MQLILALFQSTRDVIKAERACLAAGITCKVIPVPREISSECGMALEIDSTHEERLQKVCAEHEIAVNFYRRGST